MALQHNGRVSFLGPVASYTHQATRQAFGPEDWELVPVPTIDDIFDSVESGNTIAGVVPFENSTNGSVVFTFDNLADREGRYGNVVVQGEVYLDVHHSLLGFAKLTTGTDDVAEGSGNCTPTATDPNPLKPKTRPLCSLKHIRRLYSHPQAFGQCNAFISTYLKTAEIFEVSSTSKAAEIVSCDESGRSAAISSAFAGECYHLDVLGRAIEDRDDNTTRFLIIARGDTASYERKTREAQESLIGTKSMVSFTVPHRSPGALANVLSCFKLFDLNLTSINSRPSLKAPFQYIFFVEFEGHKLDDPENKVKGVLEKIDSIAQSWRWLGSWQRDR